MDEVTKEDVSRQSESELTSPLSPKRPRTDWAVTEDLSGKSTSDSSEPRTLQKSYLSSSNPQNPESLAFTAECGDYHHKKPRDTPQDDTLRDTHLTTLHGSGVDKESDEVCFISAEQNEKPSVTETDNLSPYLRVYTDGYPPPTNNNTSSLPNCAQLGKSCEDETPSSFSLSTGNDKDGTQSDVSQLQTVPSCSNQPDCSSKDAEQHTGLCYTGSQLAEVMKTNQEGLEADFSNCVPLSKTGDKSPISSRDLVDPNPLYLHPEEVLSWTLAEDGKNEKQKPELQSCENLSVWEVKTEVNDSSKTLFCSAAACAEGSNLPNAGVLDTNISAEDVSFEVDNYSGAGRSAETSKISQEPAEGDNDSDTFSVIDPAICSEIDAEVEGMLCNSDSTAGRELPPIVKICNTETALPLCSDVKTSQVEEFNHICSTQPSKDENQIRCQSVISKGTQDKADAKASCQFSPSNSSAKPPPAEVEGIQESPDTMGYHLKCFAVVLDHVETQEVEYLQSETDRGVEAAGIKPAQFLKEKQIDKQESPTKPIKTGETSEQAFICDGKLKCTDGEQENKPESLSDKPDSFVMGVIDGEERGEGINVGKEIKPSECEDSEIWEISEDIKKYPTSMSCDKKQDSNVKEESPDESISEWVEGSRFTVCSGDDSEQRLGCFSHYQISSDIFLTIPSANDAVVPCQPNLEHSEDPQSGSTALKCSDRFPLSAFALCNHVLRGFDTFKKIKLSPDYDDDDVAGLSNMPLLTSLTGEMLETPQQQLQHHQAKTELDIHKSVEDKEEGEKEEEVEGIGCHMENVANGIVSCDSAHTDASNSISAADVIELVWPEQQPNCGSASDSSEDTHNEPNPQSGSSAAPPESGSPPSDLNHSFQFEMKENFNRVLKELSLFFDISKNDFDGDCGPKSTDVPEPPESHIAKITSGRLSSQELGCHRETSTDKADEDHSLEMCGVDPVVCLPALRSDSEQEVPLNENLCQEPSRDTAEKHKEPQNVEQKVKMRSPSAVCFPLLEQLRHRPPEQPRRLEPLKTCTRPIRVGLSKRAKTKHLHCSHPYK